MSTETFREIQQEEEEDERILLIMELVADGLSEEEAANAADFILTLERAGERGRAAAPPRRHCHRRGAAGASPRHA